MKILILSISDAFEGQIIAAFLRSFDPMAEVISAGISPAKSINPIAFQLLFESFLEDQISQPKHFSQFESTQLDHLLFTTKRALLETPQQFKNNAKKIHQLYIKLPENEQSNLSEYRKYRDEIKQELFIFFKTFLRN